jgi:hypothetical protein
MFKGRETIRRKDFVALVAFCRDQGLRVGATLDDHRFADRTFLRAALEAGLRRIEIPFSYPDARTYAEMTDASPGDFPLLLRALDNIDSLSAELRRPLELQAIAAVGSINLRRLAEVMRILQGRLPRERLSVVLERADALPCGDRHPKAATLEGLRASLPSLLVGWRFPFPVALRGFPLCAVPGYEHLDDTVSFLRKAYQAGPDFFRERAWEQPRPDAGRRPRQETAQACARCTLAAVCFHRQVLLGMEAIPANRPVPSARPLQEVLVASGCDPREARKVIGLLRSRPQTVPAAAGGS